MAQQTVIPQHVTALLSHLTSRPGVQSTFILSRKDGSIIQSTGLLAADLEKNTQNAARSAQATPVNEVSTSTPTPGSPAEQQQQPEAQSEEQNQEQEQQEGQEEQQGDGQREEQEQEQKPYKPTHAEALAAHIFAFVSSASDLSISLSHPPEDNDSKPNGSSGLGHSETHGLANGISPRDEADSEGQEKEEDDEVKLLRLRTKKHEIVVVPDRKYLLCVVHDAASVGMGGRSR